MNLAHKMRLAGWLVGWVGLGWLQAELDGLGDNLAGLSQPTQISSSNCLWVLSVGSLHRNTLHDNRHPHTLIIIEPATVTLTVSMDTSPPIHYSKVYPRQQRTALFKGILTSKNSFPSTTTHYSHLASKEHPPFHLLYYTLFKGVLTSPAKNSLPSTSSANTS